MGIILSGISLSNSGSPLPIANGGTGQTTASAALLALLPSPLVAGDYLKTDGSTVFWAAGGGGGGSPGGSNGQIQYNNSGSFGGFSNLTWNDTAIVVGHSSYYYLTLSATDHSGYQTVIRTPDSTTSGTSVSALSISTGNVSGSSTSTARNIFLAAGSDGVGNGVGGSINITAGTSAGSYAAGDVVLNGGGGSGTSAGGNVILNGGTNGSGTTGSIKLILGGDFASPALQIDANTAGNGPGPWTINGSHGTSGQVLISGGAGVSPSWATPESGATITNVSVGSGIYNIGFTSATSGSLSTLDVINDSSNLIFTFDTGSGSLIIGDPSGADNYDAFLTTPSVTGGTGVSSTIYISTGTSNVSTGTTGGINITPGNATGTTGIGGNVSIAGGGSTTGTGGNVTIAGGSISGAGGTAGNVQILAGISISGTQGVIQLTVGNTPVHPALEINADSTGVTAGDWKVNGNAGTAGQALISAGTGVSPAWGSYVGTSWNIQTSAYLAVAGDRIMADTTSAAFTITLPASPSANDRVIISDAAGTFATHNLTVAYNGNKLMGSLANMTLNMNNVTVTLDYINSTYGWRLV